MTTTNNKQQVLSPYRVMWLIISKEYIYMDAARGARKLNFSKKVEKELQKRGFVKINKHWCKWGKDVYSHAADRLYMQAFISRTEPIAKRQAVQLFYITDKQFGACHTMEYKNVRTRFQCENTIRL